MNRVYKLKKVGIVIVNYNDYIHTSNLVKQLLEFKSVDEIVVVLCQDQTACGLREANQHLHQRCFSCTVGSDESVDVAFFDVNAHIFNCLKGTVFLGQLFRFQMVLHLFPLSVY